MTVRAKSLVTLSLTASLVSCATLPVFASDNKTDDEKVTIRVAWWGNQTRNDLTVKALDLYTPSSIQMLHLRLNHLVGTDISISCQRKLQQDLYQIFTSRIMVKSVLIMIKI